ncbi:PREDICTED: uncharacterized protein LOC109230281 [Nicotiana attenuata]|uniref:uncharacterized protein LOC109230281 n=1 Tax=Nicotiana attenuata TaxID=49451 RepID=UPI000905089E|nr:PREDICTED: uncharacterized protein LOC109230281 [Nicotiana attenuata]
MIANCIKEAAREVLGVSNSYFSGYKGDRRWNEEVRRKVIAKKAAYLKLVESADEEENRTNRELYKKNLGSKEVKESVQVSQGEKKEDRDLDQVKRIKDEEVIDLMEDAHIKRRWQKYFQHS